ncbi:Os07g0185100 [Oryza sativa Japonica Group]|uniref:Os07g0185100 protein n=1 Tax=Oryza sativa subsp. japonica TaxID=39947 RepID=A0A0P0X3N0_ORYSJ|nr:hypothetical protein EE612_037534 [Oryza sativa]BAT00361.1 Os07g0185100 [Oryza sativa Japonica Group]
MPLMFMTSLSLPMACCSWLLPPVSEELPCKCCSSSSSSAWNVISSNRPCSSAHRLQPWRSAAAADDMKSTSEPQDDDDDAAGRQFLQQAAAAPPGASGSSPPPTRSSSSSSSVAGPGLQPGTSAATLPSISWAMRVTSWSVMSSSATISAATVIAVSASVSNRKQIIRPRPATIQLEFRRNSPPHLTSFCIINQIKFEHPPVQKCNDHVPVPFLSAMRRPR